MFVSHQFSMRNLNNGRRHGRLRHLLTTLTLGGLLAGCEATAASNKEKTPAPEKAVTNKSVEDKSKTVTRDECLALLPDKPKTKNCLSELNRQLALENAAKKKELDRLNQTLEALEKIKEFTTAEEPNR